MKQNTRFAAVLCILPLFFSCRQDAPFTGIRLDYDSEYTSPGGTKEIAATYFLEDAAPPGEQISVTIEDDETGGAELSAASVVSGEKITVTVGNKKGKTVKIKFSSNGFDAFVVLETETDEFSLSDSVSGFAKLGVDVSKFITRVEVTTAAELRNAVKDSGRIIVIKNDIDMSEGLLPPKGSISTDSTGAMNDFVSKHSDVKTYAEWLKKYSNVSSSEDTKTSDISNAYKKMIQLDLQKNTAIVGENNPVIRGVTFSVRQNNIVIRNITIQDAVDPFPHHEKGDGFNAQHDGVCIDGGKGVWIDHCTFEDTLTLGTAANGEKWQVYDGLCDIKGDAQNITVSFCVFKNHDKTMLIGSSDKDGSSETRTITLQNNYFLNCGQRCPMVRNSKIHIFNNVYDSDSSRKYNSQTSINARAGSIVCQENNYFGSVASANESGGSIYSPSNCPFNPASFYNYFAKKTAKRLSDKAGAGLLSYKEAE